jgi:hypothetical protein
MQALQILFCSRPKLQADLNPKFKTLKYEHMVFISFVDRKGGLIFRKMFAFVYLEDKSDVSRRFFGTSQATLNLHLMSSFSIVLVLFLHFTSKTFVIAIVSIHSSSDLQP